MENGKKLIYDDGKIKVMISEDPNDWYVVKDENYKPDRGVFVLEKFIEDFPHIKIDKVEDIYSLCSRSKKLAIWLAQINIEYASTEQTPTFFRSVIDSKEYSKVSVALVKLNDANKNRAIKEKEAVTKYKESMKKIEEEYDKLAKIENNYAKVIAMNSTSLPLTIQLAIENYSPASNIAPTSKSFAREMLIQYKVGLIKLINEDNNIKIDDIIEENQTL